jgi:hypothetical protein
MATRYAGQKIRATYGGITGGVVDQKLLASAGPATAKAGAEPLCTEFS